MGENGHRFPSEFLFVVFSELPVDEGELKNK
jgi:hypothetical protein